MNPPRILIVEDEAVVALDIQRRLDSLLYAVAGVTASGEESVRLAGQLQPDLILMDIHLEGAMDGIMAAEQIHRRFRLPVVFLTAYAEAPTLERAKLADPFGYILKPFEDRDLKTVIEMALYKHQSGEEIHRLNRLYAVLSHVNQAVVHAASREDLLQQICRAAIDHGAFKAAGIGWLDPLTQAILPAARWGAPECSAGLDGICAGMGLEGPGPAQTALREGRPWMVNNLAEAPGFRPGHAALAQAGLQSLAAFPIRFHQQTAGLLILGAGEINFFKDRELGLLEEVAADVSFALDHLDGEARRRHAEEALRKSQASLERAEAFSTLLVTQVALDGRWLKAPPLLGQLLGWTEAELLAGRIQDVLHPEDAGADWGEYQRLLQGDRKGFSSEKRLQGRQGQTLWFDVSVALVADEAGQPERFLTYLRDITSQKQAMEKIRAQAELLDLTQDAIMVWDLKGQITFWNKSAERIYGWAAAEILGSEAQQFLHQNSDFLFPTGLEQVLAAGQWCGELKTEDKAGRKLAIQSRWLLLKNSAGTPTAMLVVDSDITEQKKLEARLLLAQRMECVGHLASGIAHDLNNILAPITMASGMLREELQGHPSLRLLNTIESSARRGASVVRQVLAFGRGQGGEKQPLQLHHLIKEMAYICRETFPKSITLDTARCAPDLWPVLGDATQLNQVLMNLCVNARDAMPEGGSLSLGADNLQADVRTAAGLGLPQPGPYVLLSVSDTGAGIAPENLAKIFDPFFTTKALDKGTGLGLATVYGIVKTHQGAIQVESQLGVGTRFNVYLPAAVPEAAKPPEPEARKACQGNNELVLVVDDEENIRQTMVRVLETHGYRTQAAADGAQAIALYARQPGLIHLVLTDLMMPNMDGVAAIRCLREMNPQAKIIVTSGLGSNILVTEAMALGANAFLPKPCSAASLLETVRDVLQNGKNAAA